ncbi:MAG: hypothetical protein QNJ97_00225 [Myxococcota bacterium]|nr:hypothetical protein [Myxococcota bacterium]
MGIKAIKKWLATGLAMGIVIGISQPALSQKSQKPSGGVIRLEETIIEGRVQKPNAFFINTRQALVYEGMALKESFIDEIKRSVETGSF